MYLSQAEFDALPPDARRTVRYGQTAEYHQRRGAAVRDARRDPVCIRCSRCRWFDRRFYGVASDGRPVPINGRPLGGGNLDTFEFWRRVRCRRCDAVYEFPRERLRELLDDGRRDLTLGVDL